MSKSKVQITGSKGFIDKGASNASASGGFETKVVVRGKSKIILCRKPKVNMNS